jgi:hypothetical protein
MIYGYWCLVLIYFLLKTVSAFRDGMLRIATQQCCFCTSEMICSSPFLKFKKKYDLKRAGGRLSTHQQLWPLWRLSTPRKNFFTHWTTFLRALRYQYIRSRWPCFIILWKVFSFTCIYFGRGINSFSKNTVPVVVSSHYWQCWIISTGTDAGTGTFLGRWQTLLL